MKSKQRLKKLHKLKAKNKKNGRGKKTENASSNG